MTVLLFIFSSIVYTQSIKIKKFLLQLTIISGLYCHACFNYSLLTTLSLLSAPRVLGAIVLLLIGLPVATLAETTVSNPTPDQNRLHQLQQQITQTREKLKQIHTQQSQQELVLQQTDQKINHLVRQIFSLQKRIGILQQKLEQLQKDIIVNQQQLQTQKNYLSQLITAAFVQGQQAFIKLLLNQQDPAVFSRVMTYFQYFNQARTRQIEKIQNLIAQLQQQQEQYNLLQQEIEMQRYLKQDEKQALEQQQQQRKQQLALLLQQQQDTEQDLANLLQNEKRIKLLLSELDKVNKKLAFKTPKRPFSRLKHKLYWPLRGKIKKLYHKWRSYQRVKWRGNIILAPEGRDVYAIADGTVVYADWLRGYGLLTIINHGQGYMSLYGFGQALFTEVGESVRAGQVISKSGRTSGRKKAGIYFEIRKKGKPVNPALWCYQLPPES